MARYALSLPAQLKQDAEHWAERQGISLNQFVMWAVAEKVGALSQHLDDPAFPQIAYRRSGRGQPVPVLRGTALRVTTLVVAARKWDMSPAEIARAYDIAEAQVQAALAFAAAHEAEIAALIAADTALEAAAVDG